jgi:maleate cis-trans isomerase
MGAAAYGSLLRMGIIVPADNVITEPEMYGLGLRGVSYHVARLGTEDRSTMRDDAVRAAESLATAGVDATAYACSETSALETDSSAQFTRRLADAAGAPAVTATSAVVEMLGSLSARRVVLVTPYRAQYGQQVEDAYRRLGFDVVRALHRPFDGGAGLPEWHATNRQPPETVEALALSVEASDADAVVLPATNLPTLSIFRALATKLGRPVVTGNRALAWWCLHRAGLNGEAERVAGQPW